MFYGIQKEPFMSMLKSYGAEFCEYLPMAASGGVHRKIELSSEEKEFYGADVSFMGAGYPNRHAMFMELTEFNLNIWGTGWENNRKLEPYVQKQGERVSIEESVKIYNATKININLHSAMSSAYFDEKGDFVNPRTFEIIACRGFQLVDARSLMPELLEPGKDIITFSSLQDLKSKIKYYLENPQEREKIVENGYRKLMESHLYKHRIEKMIADAYQYSAKFREGFSQEIQERNRVLDSIKDEKFISYIESLPIEKKNSFKSILEDIKSNKGDFKNYEVILLILDTFYSNSG